MRSKPCEAAARARPRPAAGCAAAWRARTARRACGSSGSKQAIRRSRKRRRSDAGPVNSPSMAGREPDHLDMLGQRAGARLVLAVDAHDAAGCGGCVVRAGSSAGADVDAAMRRVAGARPPPSPPSPTARQLGIGRAAQALAGGRAATGPRADWSCPSRWARTARPAAGPTLERQAGIVAEVR